VSSGLDIARQEWAESYRRLHGDPVGRDGLLAQVELVTEELRRRVGQTFTLAELAEAWRGAEYWVRQIVEERAPTPGWSRNLALVEGAAFHLYSRGASDYAP
jgi:hypothetical protein